MIRVALADDHALVRSGLRAVLADEPDIEVVGEATTGDAARQLCIELQPDVLLLDLAMPGPPAIDTGAFLHSHAADTRIVILSGYCDGHAARELVSLGVVGYVLKDDEPEVVAEAIRCAARGGTWFSRLLLDALAASLRVLVTADGSCDFTDRERELLALVRHGRDNKRIADELCLGEQTVRNYLRGLYRKIGVTSRAEAVVWTHEHDLGDS